VPPETDIRWKQRLQNFRRALVLLADALEPGPPRLSLLEKEGVVQRFEYTFELAWKTVKDYLEAGGLTIAPITPRHVLKEAFLAKVVSDGQIWIDMLDHRNLLSHTYDSPIFEDAVDAIAARYLAAMKDLDAFLAAREAE
jgi:nucleotidyltransferase substrate binding protein (TIGR01987 family)